MTKNLTFQIATQQVECYNTVVIFLGISGLFTSLDID